MTRLFRSLAVALLLMLLLAAPLAASIPDEADAGLTAVFVRYYTAVAKGRWSDAFHLLHEQLKTATEVRSPEDLASKNSNAQQELIDAFQAYDRLDVAKTEVDLGSIKARVTAAGNGNVAGEVTYDLFVFPKGPGRPLTYRVVMDVGLAQGQIIRITQHSMVRIDPGGVADAI